MLLGISPELICFSLCVSGWGIVCAFGSSNFCSRWGIVVLGFPFSGGAGACLFFLVFVFLGEGGGMYPF